MKMISFASLTNAISLLCIFAATFAFNLILPHIATASAIQATITGEVMQAFGYNAAMWHDMEKAVSITTAYDDEGDFRSTYDNGVVRNTVPLSSYLTPENYDFVSDMSVSYSSNLEAWVDSIPLSENPRFEYSYVDRFDNGTYGYTYFKVQTDNYTWGYQMNDANPFFNSFTISIESYTGSVSGYVKIQPTSISYKTENSVPVPSTMILLSSGIAGLAGLKRKKIHQTKTV